MMGQSCCEVALDSIDGHGDCIVTSGVVEGAACFYLNDCAAGLMCFSKVCRRYCRTGGAPCPNGQSCNDIVIQGLTIQFKANKTGVCHRDLPPVIWRPQLP
jgi:hypothetical protein